VTFADRGDIDDRGDFADRGDMGKVDVERRVILASPVRKSIRNST
jgi:hypothetical protein